MSSSARAGTPRPSALRGGGIGRLTDRAGTAAGIAGLAAALALVIVTATGSRSRSGELLLISVVIILVGLIVGHVQRFLLPVVILDIGLQWDVNLAYHQAEAKLGALGGLSLSVTTVALAGLYLVWFLQPASERPRLATRAALPLIVYIGATAVSIAVAPDRALGGYQVFLLTQTLLLFLYVASAVRRPEDVAFVLGALFVTMIIQGLIIVASRLGADPVHLLGVSTQVERGTSIAPAQEQLRSGGTIGSPNNAGAFFSLLLAPAAAVVASSASRALKRLAAVAFAVGMVGLILTFSRGAWVALAVSLGVMSFWGWRRGWFRARVPVAIAAAVLLIALPLAGAIGSRLNRNDAGAAHTRVPLMKIAANVIEDHPILGVGANNFAVVLPDYAGYKYSGEFLYVVHNTYLAIWSQAGFTALLAFLWFLGATLRRARSLAWSRDPFLSPVAVGLGAAVIGHMAHMLVDIFQGRPNLELLWLIAALLVAMSTMTRAGAET